LPEGGKEGGREAVLEDAMVGLQEESLDCFVVALLLLLLLVPVARRGRGGGGGGRGRVGRSCACHDREGGREGGRGREGRR